MSAPKKRLVSGYSGLVTSYISTENGTTTPTTAFTGQYVYGVQYATVRTTVSSSDQNGTIYFDFSDDGTTTRQTISDTVTAGVDYFRIVDFRNSYVRIRWTCGVTPTLLDIYTTFSKTEAPLGVGVTGNYVAGTAISITGASSPWTITNTAPDQTLTSAGGTSIIKAYPVMKGLTGGTGITLAANTNDVQITNSAPYQPNTSAGGTSLIKADPVLYGLTAGTGVSLTTNTNDIAIGYTGTTTAVAAGTGISINTVGTTSTITNSAPYQANTSAGGTSLIKADPILYGLTAGTGISLATNTNDIGITNSGVTSAVAGSGIGVSGATGAVTFTNTAPYQANTSAGGTSLIKADPVLYGLTAGAGISLATNTNDVGITNSGVTSIVAGTGISISGATGAVTVTNNGSVPVVGSIIAMNNSIVSLNGGTTKYFGLTNAEEGHKNGYVTAAEAYMAVPMDGTIDRLYIHTDGTGAATRTRTHTLYQNGAATALSVVITGTQTDNSDTSNVITVAQGDLVCLRFTESATTLGQITESWSMRFKPT